MTNIGGKNLGGISFPVFGLFAGSLFIYSGIKNVKIIDIVTGNFTGPSDSYAKAHSDVSTATSPGFTAGNPLLMFQQGNGTMDGHPVASWILPILKWAKTHGWHGSVTSGVRTPAQQDAAARHYGLEHYGPKGAQGSNHLTSAYPGGAVDVTNAAQLDQVLHNYPGSPTLVWGGPVIGDDVHFSATGH